MHRVLFIPVLLSAAGCASNHLTKSARPADARQTQISSPSARLDGPTDPTGFHRTPIEFLEFLKQSPQQTLMIIGSSPGWIRDADIHLLMARLQSQARCAHVKDGASSHQPLGETTEGLQAAFLIEGFRQHRYPPRPTSDGFVPDVDGLKTWYQQWSTHR